MSNQFDAWNEPRKLTGARGETPPEAQAADIAMAQTVGRLSAGSTPTSLEQKEQISRAAATGTATGSQQVKYQDLLTQFGIIRQDVDSVLEPLNRIPAGRLAGPAAQVGAAFGQEGSEDVLLYTNTKDLIVSKIAKTFGGEVGLLTEGDIQRISKAFPAIWMNDRERQVQIQWIKDYIQRRLTEYGQRTQSAPAGSSVTSEQRAAYNAARAQGQSPEAARQAAGL